MTEEHVNETSPPALRNRPLLIIATTHWLSMIGLALVVTAIVTWLIFLAAQMRAESENPYIGIALFVVIPLILLVGLVLTPIGVFLGRRQAAARLRAGITDRRRAVPRLIAFMLIVTALNLTIGTQATLHAVHHMETRQFCASCHVMTPESRAGEHAPHASLGCVDCHVGSGALGWVESKINGTRQLLEVMFDNVPKPIPGAIASGRMVSSDETCERCHWADKPTSLRLKVIKRYDEDEENTEMTTVLTMHVGGKNMGGIHGAHNAPGVEIRFAASDANRQEIPWVEYTNSKTGEKRTYLKEGADPAAVSELAVVKMQCVDCHNRVAHSFRPLEVAVDRALALGEISVGLPYVKMKSVEILEAEYANSAEAAEKIPQALIDYYRSEHATVFAERQDMITEAGKALADIYSRNVFPELAVTWGTYPDNSSHEDFPGCYRCHEGEHKTEDGLVLNKDCFVCHNATAVEETDPEILKQLGLLKILKKMEQK